MNALLTCVVIVVVLYIIFCLIDMFFDFLVCVVFLSIAVNVS